LPQQLVTSAPATPPELWAPVYARAVKGRFRSVKSATAGLLLAVFLILPWLRWERGAGAVDQAVLIDIPGARAYLFGIEIWPQEVYYFTGLMILAAVGLFLATTLFGRLWCGYACPQTVWTDLFMAIERQFEGDRNARLKRDKGPWTLNRLARKLGKHAAWLALSGATALAFLVYFVDAPTALRGEVGTNALCFLAIVTAATYGMAGFTRDLFCTYMCPWPRIQAPMLDEHSIIVSYDAGRGETRGHARQGQSFVDRGHCLDCRLCVQVCPTGIDIRNGMQMACIGCGLCIDACNGVMERFGLPRNLVGWTSLAAMKDPAAASPRRRLLRGRIFAYGAIMLGVAALLATVMSRRVMLDLNVLHDRSPEFVRMANGEVQNGFTVKIINKERRQRRIALSLHGLESASLSVIGQGSTDGQGVALSVGPDTVEPYRILVRKPVQADSAVAIPLSFELRDQDSGATASHDSIFITGEAN
jgi:cytochrome c oxidase accessory protein FixG